MTEKAGGGRRLGAETKYDVGWSDEKKCQDYCKKCPCWKEIRSQSPGVQRKWEQKSKNIKVGLEVAKRNHDASFE